MRRHWLILLIPWLVGGCVHLSGQTRATWPIPSVPEPVVALQYEAGWFQGVNQYCLNTTDYTALSAWVRAHFKREIALETELVNAQDTINTVNGLVR